MTKIGLKKFAKLFKKCDLTYKNRAGEIQEYTYTLEFHADIFYIKLYYAEDIDHFNIEDVYKRAITWFLPINYHFNGLNEYRNNKEICLTFLKD